MAKRKKRKSGKGGGGGASGKAKARQSTGVIVPFSSGGELIADDIDALPNRASADGIEQRMREKDDFMAMVSREIAKHYFSTAEEAEAFLNANFMGRPMVEMLEEYGRHGDSAEGRALEDS